MEKDLLIKDIEKKESFAFKPTRLIILILGLLTALSPFSVDMYLPGFAAMAKDFNTDISKIGLSLTTYFIGISFGQLVYGPLLDRFGRKKPLIFGLSLYVISSIGCLFAPSLNFLIVMRLFSALGGCVGTVASMAIVRDLFPVKETAKIFSILILILGISPIIAPTVGGFILSSLNWRYIFALLTIISMLLLAAVVFLLPESKGINKEVSLKLNKIIGEYLNIIQKPAFIIYTLAGAFTMSGIFAYVSGSPYVYMELFKLTEKEYGIVFGINAAAMIAGSQINRYLLNKMSPQQILFSLNLAQLAGVSVLITGAYLEIFSKTIISALILVYLLCLGFITPNTSALSMASFKENAGSASALNGSLQMLLGAPITIILSYLQSGTALPMISIMAVCSLISFSLIYFGNKLKTSII